MSRIWTQQKICSKSQKCANCGQEDHEDKDCENDPHCVNCYGNHPAYFRSCPKWKIEKKILQIKYEDTIPFSEEKESNHLSVIFQRIHMPLSQILTNTQTTSRHQTISDRKKNG